MNNDNAKPTLKSLPLHKFIRGKYQPRIEFEESAILELADSIKKNGLLQPIVARPLGNDSFEIIAGERRWRAAQKAGLKKIYCLVNTYTDEQAAGASIVENLNRKDLNPIEEAKAYQRLIDEFNYRHEEVAATLGKSRTKITNSLRLLNITKKLQNRRPNGQLSEGHGKILDALPTQMQLELGFRCIELDWSVRQLENKIKNIKDHQKKLTCKNIDPNLSMLSRKISEHLGCPVSLQYKKGKGTLTIDFHSNDILEGIFHKMGFEFDA